MRAQFKVWQLLDRSQSAWDLSRRVSVIDAHLAVLRVKVLPVAWAARWLGISERLMWSWVKRGIVRKRRPRSGSMDKKGITTKTLRAFIRRLGEAVRDQREMGALGPDTNRKRPAFDKCVKAASLLRSGREYTAREFAKEAGISVSSVRRFVAKGTLPASRPTLHRIRICDSFTKYRQRRKNHLTR